MLDTRSPIPETAGPQPLISYKPQQAHFPIQDQSVRLLILKLLTNNLLAEFPQLLGLARTYGVGVEFIQVYRLDVC